MGSMKEQNDYGTTSVSPLMEYKFVNDFIFYLGVPAFERGGRNWQQPLAQAPLMPSSY